MQELRIKNVWEEFLCLSTMSHILLFQNVTWLERLSRRRILKGEGRLLLEGDSPTLVNMTQQGEEDLIVGASLVKDVTHVSKCFEMVEFRFVRTTFNSKAHELSREGGSGYA